MGNSITNITNVLTFLLNIYFRQYAQTLTNVEKFRPYVETLKLVKTSFTKLNLSAQSVNVQNNLFAFINGHPLIIEPNC